MDGPESSGLLEASGLIELFRSIERLARLAARLVAMLGWSLFDSVPSEALLPEPDAVDCDGTGLLVCANVAALRTRNPIVIAASFNLSIAVLPVLKGTHGGGLCCSAV